MKFTLHQDDHNYVQVISLKYVNIVLLLHKLLFSMFKENGYESFAFFMEAYNKINKQKMNKKY